VSLLMNRILDLSAAVGLYDWWARSHLGEIHDTLVELAELHGGEKILDVGCGTGILCSRLAQASNGVMVYGLDAGSRMIKAADKKVQRHYHQAEYRVGTVTRLPYSEGHCDVVVSCLLFHLLQDTEKELALREIFRILKPGGRYVCAEFETVPVGFFWRYLSAYPSDLIETIGFDMYTQLTGPCITKRRPVVYRVLVRPRKDVPG
jgi:ubiquinone/menaquinone biosynthesis C-methylase UbiE